jgi:Transposase DDE domain
VLFDGYKRHVLRDLDTGLITAAGITPANAPEAGVTSHIAADLDAAGLTLAELHIDRAYLSSHLVRDREPGLAIYCKAWRVRNAGRFAKDQFTLDFTAGQLTCPAGVAMPFQPGRTVRFPKGICAACHLKARCTTSSDGRSVSVHPDEALLAELRQRQQAPDGRAKLRERVAVHSARLAMVLRVSGCSGPSTPWRMGSSSAYSSRAPAASPADPVLAARLARAVRVSGSSEPNTRTMGSSSAYWSRAPAASPASPVQRARLLGCSVFLGAPSRVPAP